VSAPNDVPVFGERVGGQRYVVRPCAYGVITNEGGDFAVVATPVGSYLPGGGIEPDETPQQAVVRETLEECGLVVRPGATIAEAVQLVYSQLESAYFEKLSVFMHASIERSGVPPTETDHELRWLPRAAAADAMTHASHAWVLRGLSD
jgi:8-oxo-dGTP diphosphatase